MPRLEPGTSCITLMHANPYTIPADLKKTVKFKVQTTFFGLHNHMIKHNALNGQKSIAKTFM